MGGAYHFYCVIRGSCAADLLPQQKLLLFFYLPLVTIIAGISSRT